MHIAHGTKDRIGWCGVGCGRTFMSCIGIDEVSEKNRPSETQEDMFNIYGYKDNNNAAF